jgi:hypothetical protein
VYTYREGAYYGNLFLARWWDAYRASSIPVARSVGLSFVLMRPTSTHLNCADHPEVERYVSDADL